MRMGKMARREVWLSVRDNVSRTLTKGVVYLPMNLANIVEAAEIERETGLGKDLLPKWRVRPRLTHLRQSLAPAIEIRVGGAGVAFIKRAARGVCVFSDLHEAVAALECMAGEKTAVRKW